MLFVLLNDAINQHATLIAANAPKTMKMMNESEFSFVSEREKNSHECNEKWEEVCMQFFHVSNQQARQTHGSIETNMLYSWSNLNFARESKEIELEDISNYDIDSYSLSVLHYATV